MTEIALIGNPNSGKTSLFNLITGNNQRVGNWPGVTVERKSGLVKKNKDLEIQDLPGIYSMSPYSPEEKVARDYLLSQRAESILNVVDATNLERNLYLTTQLIETGIPVTLALNMSDVLEAQGKQINVDKLSYHLGVPVVATSALKQTGIDQVVKKAAHTTTSTVADIAFPIYDDKLEAAISQILEVLGNSVPQRSARFYAIKLFEHVALVEAELDLSPFQRKEIKDIIRITEEVFTEDAESIVINERYAFIERVCQMAQSHTEDFALTLSDKIDRIVTNRILALPIFAAVMYLVYFLSIQTVGTMWTDWANDVLFGKYVPDLVTSGLDYLQVQDWLKSLIVDGIVAGIGTVLGFLPQIFVLFICLGVLEDIGYMSRIAFVMDRIFRRFGLSGKSFIPMLISTGCGVPAVMSSRTIENERDRRMTIMTTTFIPCGAKLPFIAMVAGAIFGGASWVAPSAYFLGIAAIICSGIILKKTKMFAGDPAPFVMELPAYHMPTIGSVLRSMWERGWSFIKKAGTIILVSTIAVWFTTYFGVMDGKFQMLSEDQIDYSILATIGKAICWIFIPQGWGNWQATVASVTGLVAKENIVGTLGILYGGGDASVYATMGAAFTAVSGYSFLAFNLLCAPCFAAMGAIKREMNNTKWFWTAVGYQCGFAYLVSLVVNQIGGLFTGAGFSIWTIVAIAVIVAFIYLLARPYKESQTLNVSVKTSRAK